MRTTWPALFMLACGSAAASDFCVGDAVFCAGQGPRFASLQALFDAGSVNLGPGDIVHVAGNTTYPAVETVMDARHSGSAVAPVVIRGERVAGLRPLLHGGLNTFRFANVSHAVLEGFEITGGSLRCVYAEASDDITLRDVLVHDCPAHGVHSSELSGSLTIEYSELHDIGTEGADGKHTIYAQTDEVNHRGAVFSLRHSYVHDGRSGNLIKSRAERTELQYNWIEHARVQEVEMLSPDPCLMNDDPCQDPSWSDGTAVENGEMVGNVIVHGVAHGHDWAMRLGGDGTGAGSAGRYRLLNNTFIFDGAGTALRPFAAIESIELHNNVFALRGSGNVRIYADSDADWVSGRRVRGSNNWIASGSTSVPVDCGASASATCWSGTITGAAKDPGFTDLADSDLTPTQASALVGAANPHPQSPPGFSFPDPSPLPTSEPVRGALLPGQEPLRSSSGVIDIGAVALGVDSIFVDGFQ